MAKKREIVNIYCKICIFRNTCPWAICSHPDEPCARFEIYGITKRVCEFYDICPSCSGWCNGREYSKECVPFLQTAYSDLKSNLD